MLQRPLGATGLSVSAVGLGAGRIGGPETDDAAVDLLVGRALDAGINLIDTARSYGASEDRLGRALQGRRDRVVLSTKLGYGVEGVPDWTPACIEQGVEAALRRLRTDRLDVAHLHSCPRQVLEGSGVVEALGRAASQGKVRVAAYSGENDALEWAVRSGAFGVVQCSVSVVDQAVLGQAAPGQAAPGQGAPGQGAPGQGAPGQGAPGQGGRGGAVAEARTRRLGVLAKRGLGNAPWRYPQRPVQGDVAEAWDRFRALRLEAADWPDLFTRFSAFAPGVSAVLIGTADAAHLDAAAASCARGPLDDACLSALRAAWAREGADWGGRI